MKLISWNVNGIRAAERKGFADYMADVDADVVFLQETKAHPEQVPETLRELPGWGCAYVAGLKKGYSGVAVYWRQEPDEVLRGLGIDEFDDEGRVIGVRYGDLVLYGNYFPNGGRGADRVDYKLRFYDAFLAHMKAHRAQGRKVVVTGDFNTAHQDVDLARAKENQNTSGFLPEERVWLDRYLDEGWIDSFRHLHPDATERYSWWNMRTLARERNVGWRIDYFLVPQELGDAITDADIHDQVEGSDHAPVYLELDWT